MGRRRRTKVEGGRRRTTDTRRARPTRRRRSGGAGAGTDGGGGVQDAEESGTDEVAAGAVVEGPAGSRPTEHRADAEPQRLPTPRALDPSPPWRLQTSSPPAQDGKERVEGGGRREEGGERTASCVGSGRNSRSSGEENRLWVLGGRMPLHAGTGASGCAARRRRGGRGFAACARAGWVERESAGDLFARAYPRGACVRDSGRTGRRGVTHPTPIDDGEVVRDGALDGAFVPEGDEPKAAAVSRVRRPHHDGVDHRAVVLLEERRERLCARTRGARTWWSRGGSERHGVASGRCGAGDPARR